MKDEKEKPQQTYFEICLRNIRCCMNNYANHSHSSLKPSFGFLNFLLFFILNI